MPSLPATLRLACFAAHRAQTTTHGPRRCPPLSGRPTCRPTLRCTLLLLLLLPQVAARWAAVVGAAEILYLGTLWYCVGDLAAPMVAALRWVGQVVGGREGGWVEWARQGGAACALLLFLLPYGPNRSALA